MFFGQTPAQLLTRPHPKRRPRSAVGAPRQMFERPEAVKTHGPCWVTSRRGRPSPSPTLAQPPPSSSPARDVDPIEFICAVPLEDRLLTVTQSGSLHVHRWFPLKPNGSGRPFTLLPASHPLATLPEASPAAREHCGSPSYGVSTDGKWLLSGGHWDCALRCTSLTAAESTVHAHQHSAPITCLAIGADGATVVTGSADSTVVIWELFGTPGVPTGALAAPRPMHVLCGHRERVACVALSTQMDVVLSGERGEEAGVNGVNGVNGGGGGGGGGGRCIVWSASDGTFVRCLKVAGAPQAVAISHTGSGLLVYSSRQRSDGHGGSAASAHTLELFSINGCTLQRVQLDAPLVQLICTRDGEVVVASEGTRVTVRRLHDLHLLHSYHEAGDASVGKAPHGGTAPDDSARQHVSALSLCAENHHAFVGTAEGGLCILANPIVNIQVLEAIAGELLNL